MISLLKLIVSNYKFTIISFKNKDKYLILSNVLDFCKLFFKIYIKFTNNIKSFFILYFENLRQSKKEKH
ncbi:hypothetical protein bcgnr5415_08650 [Bacillus cereus]